MVLEETIELNITDMDKANNQWNEFYNQVKDRRALPLMKSAAENEELAHLFHKELVGMCAHAMRNHKKGSRQIEPRLVQALQTTLRFNSFNKLLMYEMGL